jgi:hypothetical protein
VAFESAEFNLIKDRHDAWCNVLRNLPAGARPSITTASTGASMTG